MYEWNFKKRNIVGQSAQTQARNLISWVKGNVQASVTQYTTTRRAMETLSSMGKIRTNWRSILKPLANQNLRHLSEKGEGESDGKHAVSWIWVIQGVAENTNKDDPGMQEGK